MKYLTAGESHGKGLMAILEGVPAGLAVSREDIARDMARRMSGYGRGGRMKIETDEVEIYAGLRGGITLGSPIGFVLPNRDYKNWESVMDAFTGDRTAKNLTAIRPGHADYAGCVKYDTTDARNILERASARQTAMRVAVGAVCKRYLAELGIAVGSHVVEIGGIESGYVAQSAAELAAADDNPVRCMDGAAAERMIEYIDACRKNGDTAGGKVQVVVSGLPAGFGSHVEYYRKLDYRLTGHLASVQAVKAVEIGLGTACAHLSGRHVHDEMFWENGRIVRHTNRAGGIEGGISNGEPIVITCTVKPIPTLMAGLKTVDIRTLQPMTAHPERSDVCAAPAAGVVAEAVTAFVLADIVSETLGGDTMDEVRARMKEKAAYAK